MPLQRRKLAVEPFDLGVPIRDYARHFLASRTTCLELRLRLDQLSFDRFSRFDLLVKIRIQESGFPTLCLEHTLQVGDIVTLGFWLRAGRPGLPRS